MPQTNPPTSYYRAAFSPAYRWITLGLLTILLRFLGTIWPEPFWQIYFPLFKVLRLIQGTLLDWMPFPLVYIWLPILLIYIFYRLRRRYLNRAQRTSRPWQQRLLTGLRRIASLAAALIFIFHLLWGFNYVFNPLTRVVPDLKPHLTVEELCAEAEWAARNAELARAQIQGAGPDSLPLSLLPPSVTKDMAQAVRTQLDTMGLPRVATGSAKSLHPQGALFQVGIAGIYNPFTGEGTIDAALIPPLQPVTMAHELTHANGYTDEGTCNFIAILACINADNPLYQYSGYLSYWQYITSDLYKADQLLYKMLRATLDPGIFADLRANYNVHMKYTGWMSRVGEQVNHTYLRTQGIQDGIINYNKVVTYMAAWPGSQKLGIQKR